MFFYEHIIRKLILTVIALWASRIFAKKLNTFTRLGNDLTWEVCALLWCAWVLLLSGNGIAVDAIFTSTPLRRGTDWDLEKSISIWLTLLEMGNTQ